MSGAVPWREAPCAGARGVARSGAWQARAPGFAGADAAVIRGAVSWRTGLSAEDRVADHYEHAGAAVRHRRWRGRGGEIDLVVRSGGVTVFVEVKAARTHAQAAERLRARQAARVMAAAEEFCAGEPSGALTVMRFDVALVDASGRIEIVENALMA